MKKFFLIVVSFVVMTAVMSCSNNKATTSNSVSSSPSDAAMTEQSTTGAEVGQEEAVEAESVENQDDSIAQTAQPDKSKGKIVVLDFFATWCGPCKKMAPDMEKMEKKYAGKIEFRKIDIDQEPELAQQYNITAVPTIIVLSPEGNILDSTEGSQTADELDKMFSALL